MLERREEWLHCALKAHSALYEVLQVMSLRVVKDAGGGTTRLVRAKLHNSQTIQKMLKQRFHFCFETFHSRLLSGWAAIN